MLVDSHSHLDAAEFDADRGEVIARARQAGVTRQVLCATAAAQWPKLREVCVEEGLYPAYGLHPTFLALHRRQHLEQLRGWLEREHPVAVGECGLDYFVEGLDRQAQMEYFEAQLRLAREYELPVIVHARRAVDAVIAAISAGSAWRKPATTSSTFTSRAGSLRWPRMSASGWSGESVSSSSHSSGMLAARRRRRCARS